MENKNNNPFNNQGQDKENRADNLFKIFLNPMSRRMAATELGYLDQTYMVTQYIKDWLEDGRAQIIGHIKCERSNRMVEKITTNRELFTKESSNQISMF